MASTTVHPFEKAGLGMAPFRCVGVERRIGPIRSVLPSGVVQEVGSPGQPMGCCKYCGQGIADCYVILSADGKRFDVGCDCVRRTYKEAGIKVPVDVDRAISDVAREKRRVRAEAKRAELVERYQAARAKVATLAPDALTARVHPYGLVDRQTRKPLTLRDYVEFVTARPFATDSTMRFVCEVVESVAP